MGTWIEMHREVQSALRLYTVVPYVGTWIEICNTHRGSSSLRVVPYVGTWIEIIHSFDKCGKES